MLATVWTVSAYRRLLVGLSALNWLIFSTPKFTGARLGRFGDVLAGRKAGDARLDFVLGDLLGERIVLFMHDFYFKRLMMSW